MGSKDTVLSLLEGEGAQASLPHQCVLGKPRAALTSHPQGPPEGMSQSFGQMPLSGKQQPSHPTAFQLHTSKRAFAFSALTILPSWLAGRCSPSLPVSWVPSSAGRREGVVLCPGTTPLPSALAPTSPPVS